MSVTYLMQTDLLEDDALFWDRYHTLSPSRQKKIDRFTFTRDKRLSLAAGLLLKTGLDGYGLREQDITIDHNENGKPLIPEQPELFFNISHSENLAICSFSNREIGADVEKVTEIDLEIAKRFFYGTEHRDIMASECPEETFFDYWVLKESYMKATGLGFKLPLDAFRIALEEVISVYSNEIQMPYSFYKTTVFENFKLAVCVKGDPPDMKMRFLDLSNSL